MIKHKEHSKVRQRGVKLFLHCSQVLRLSNLCFIRRGWKTKGKATGSRSMFEKNKYERPGNLYFDFSQSRVRNFTASLALEEVSFPLPRRWVDERFLFKEERSLNIFCAPLAPLQISLNLFIFYSTRGTVEISITIAAFRTFPAVMPLMAVLIIRSLLTLSTSNFKLFNFNLYFYEPKLVQFIINEGTERKKWEMKSAFLLAPKISICINIVSHIYPSSFFLWGVPLLSAALYSISFASFLLRCRGKLLKDWQAGDWLRLMLFLSIVAREKILHENAINKQMDRNNHRMENFPLCRQKVPRK